MAARAPDSNASAPSSIGGRTQSSYAGPARTGLVLCHRHTRTHQGSPLPGSIAACSPVVPVGFGIHLVLLRPISWLSFQLVLCRDQLGRVRADLIVRRRSALTALVPYAVFVLMEKHSRQDSACCAGEAPSVWRYYENVPDELAHMRTPEAVAIADRHLWCAHPGGAGTA